MKTFLSLVAAFLFSVTALAQKTSNEKGEHKTNNEKSADRKNNELLAKEKKIEVEHNDKIWEGTYEYNEDVPEPSKTQPAGVRAAFQKDYPNATNISWSKYRGNWATTFRNTSSMSTALYHANGDRRDTRTLITKNEIPRSVFDSIFNRRRGTWLENIIKIETPGSINDIFRIKDVLQGKPEYLFYDSAGKLVKYNY